MHRGACNKKNNNLFGLIILGILGIITLIIVVSFDSPKAEAQVIRLTDNLYPDVYPQIYGNLLTWQAFIDQNALDYIDGDWEIFCCFLSSHQEKQMVESVKQITDNAGDDIAPQTNGEYIVWQGEGENSTEIFLYDMKSDTSKQITNDKSEDFFPQIWNDWIVWTSKAQRDGILGPGEIFLYQISTGQITLLSQYVDQGNIRDDTSPSIGYVSGDNCLNSDHPAGNLVLWGQSDGENSVSYLYNLDSGNIEVMPEGFIWPQTRQRDGQVRVLSRSLTDAYGDDREIFIYQIAAKQYRQITHNTYADRYPCLHDRTIAWMAGEGAGAEIFLTFYDPNASGDIHIDMNPLITGDIMPDPVIPPFIHSDSEYTPPTSSQGGNSGISKEPQTRCFINFCNW